MLELRQGNRQEPFQVEGWTSYIVHFRTTPTPSTIEMVVYIAKNPGENCQTHGQLIGQLLVQCDHVILFVFVFCARIELHNFCDVKQEIKLVWS